MTKSTKLPILSVILINISIILGIYGCASVKRPEGGPRDTTPPKVLKMEPENFTKNFRGDKIVITFDEYFNIQNESAEFSISPSQEENPQLKKNQKKLEIIFKDSLEKNTTYVLNFGNAIADVNENNVAKNLTYAFSTGDKLDSLEISGNVFNIGTGKEVLNATVFIFPIERDTLLGKNRPAIFTSTDSSGYFNLKHLKEGTYKIYAIKEEGTGDKIYQQRTDEIGFLKDSIQLTKNLNGLKIGLFKENPPVLRILDQKINSEGIIQIVTNKGLENPNVEIINSKEYNESKILKYGLQKDSINIWPKDYKFDTLEIAISENKVPIDTLKFGIDKSTRFNQILTIKDNINNSSINPYTGLNLYFNYPLKNIELKKIKLLEDTIPLQNYTIEKIEQDPFAYRIKFPWKKKVNYIIQVEDDAITSIYDTKNKSYRRQFTLGNTDDYGTYNLLVKVPDSAAQYILEILNDKKKVIMTNLIKADTTIALVNYRTENYYTRVVYDDNKNGKWDTGNVLLKKQPEAIWNNPQDFLIRSNWIQNTTFIIPPHPNSKKDKEPEKEKK